MGADLISIIEYSCLLEIETAGFEHLRSASTGELFMPRNPEIQHALGLPKCLDFLPEPLIPLRGFPKNLSQQTVETQCVILSEKSAEEVRNRTGHSSLKVLNAKRFEELLPFHGTSAVYKLGNKDAYFSHLEPNEDVVIGLGTLCPGWLYSFEIKEAVAHCGLNIDVNNNPESSLAHFGSVVEWMQSLENIYGRKGVRFVFWYDSVPNSLIGLESAAQH